MASVATKSRTGRDYTSDACDEFRQPPSGPVDGEQRQRFKVVVRPPAGRSRRRLGDALPMAFLTGVVPTLIVLTYVLSGTMAMRGGYYRAQLSDKLKDARIEQADLQAEKRQLQSAGNIMHQAAALGMRPAKDREFRRLPAATPVAAEEDSP